MYICPLQNTAKKVGNLWTQPRPLITQSFGERPNVYKQFGMNGHNGVDFRARNPINVHAPFDGETRFANQKDSGYGLHVKIRNPYKRLECVLAHLSEARDSLSRIGQGDVVGLTGNTGFSSGPHLHFGVRRLIDNGNNDVWTWPVEEYDNGFFGYFDPLGPDPHNDPWMIWWKGASYKLTL